VLEIAVFILKISTS